MEDFLDSLNTHDKELKVQSNKLLDLYLKRKIREKVYEAKSKEIEKEISSVDSEIVKHKGADRAYKHEIESFLVFCNEAPKPFVSSRPTLQRELLRFVVSNLILEDKKLYFSLKTPFDIVAKHSTSANWQGWRESNPHQRFWRPLFYH